MAPYIRSLGDVYMEWGDADLRVRYEREGSDAPTEMVRERWREAERTIRLAESVTPNDFWVLLDRGHVAARLEQPATVHRYVERADASMMPGNPHMPCFLKRLKFRYLWASEARRFLPYIRSEEETLELMAETGKKGFAWLLATERA
jgi:hypothetical protein